MASSTTPEEEIRSGGSGPVEQQGGSSAIVEGKTATEARSGSEQQGNSVGSWSEQQGNSVGSGPVEQQGGSSAIVEEKRATEAGSGSEQVGSGSEWDSDELESDWESEGDDVVYPTYESCEESDDDYESLTPLGRIEKAIMNFNVPALRMAFEAAKVKDVDTDFLPECGMSPLELACYYGSAHCVKFLLIHKNASITGSGRAFVGTTWFGKSKSTPMPPFHIALMLKMLHIVHYLIEYASTKGLLAQVLGAPPNGSPEDATILPFVRRKAEDLPPSTVRLIMDSLNSLPNLSKNKRLEVTNDAEASPSNKPKLEVSGQNVE